MKLTPLKNFTPSFGYSKSLDNKLNKRLNQMPNSNIYTAIRDVNICCNKIEDEIVRLEGKDLLKVDKNEDVIDFLTDFLIGAKLWLANAISRCFPDLNYVKESMDCYDREQVIKTTNAENRGIPINLTEGQAYHWREDLWVNLIDIYSAGHEGNIRIETCAEDEFMQMFGENESFKSSMDSKKDSGLVKKFTPSKNSPKSLNDVVGLNSCIDEIKNIIILPLEDIEKAKQREIDYGIEIPGFVLLYGAPGCGKTMLAEAICAQVDCDMYKIDISSIGSTFINETAMNIANAYNEVAKKAKESEKPTLLFLDEMDSLLPKRHGEVFSSEDDKITNTFLPLIVKAKDDNIIIIGATNAYDFLDPAVKDRADYSVYIGLPDEKEIIELLKRNLEKIKMGKSLAENEEELALIAKDLKGYSPRTINAIIKKASSEASKLEKNLSGEDFKKALENGSWEKIDERQFLSNTKKDSSTIGFTVN